jgi:hypothetical protein
LTGWSAADVFGFLEGTDSSECGTCAGDANADGLVDFQDLITILGDWGCEG